jgi:alkanesulfonate monooxygenase SsuD/methylene tetrahydromethanopterin reductase-like flavin-dependent oxidoreductase (luciferase family)
VIDMLSRGRLVSGWVRGTGRESLTHNAHPAYNWDRFREAHDFIVKAWTTPGPFEWDGEFFQYRYVNPWMRPYQKPHPQIWVPGILSRNTVRWAAERRYPYVMLDSKIELTKQTFDFYREVARENGYEAGPQHLGYMLKVHVDETEEEAQRVGRKLIDGPGNIFLDGSTGQANPFVQNLPGINPRDPNAFLPTAQWDALAVSRGVGHLDSNLRSTDERPPTPEEREARRQVIWQDQLDRMATVVGTPESVLPKLKHIVEELRPGAIFFWSGDGSMTHEETMRGIRLMGEHVVPELRQFGTELGLTSSFETDIYTNEPIAAAAGTP